MTLTLRIVLIIASTLVAIYTLHKIRKAQLNIDDAFYWLFFSVLILVMSIFPDIVYFFSNLLGFQTPSNFVFLLIIFLIVIKLFSLSIELSIQKHRFNNLVQRTALMYYAEANKNKKSNENE